jgi:hypothetical protein
LGKQFSILATDVDMLDLEAVIRGSGDTELLSDNPVRDMLAFEPLESLPITLKDAGKVSLFCYLAPNALPQKIDMRRISAAKVVVDIEQSYLIEFWRPFFNGITIREGRFYYTDNMYVDRKLVEKSSAFLDWRKKVVNRVKKALIYDRFNKVYIGRQAFDAISKGEITVVGG